jgi:hypothetical protein
MQDMREQVAVIAGGTDVKKSPSMISQRAANVDASKKRRASDAVCGSSNNAPRRRSLNCRMAGYSEECFLRLFKSILGIVEDVRFRDKKVNRLQRR